ncbi:MAG TPA: hypothetical protein VIL17_07805 [Coriobacteriia bacterium]
MLDRLDRISDRTAYLLVALGVGVSLLAAFLAPQDVELGAWVRLVIWHGMLKWACIVGIFGMGAIAIAYLITGRERLYEWARALQVALLPLWVFAVLIGVAAARLVWNAWNLAERRMVMSVAYTVVAAVALMLALFWDKRRVGAIAQIVTSLAMAVGLAWIELGPVGEDVHPSAAVLNSPNVAFRISALVMMVGCLLAVLALSVPLRRWLLKAEVGA